MNATGRIIPVLTRDPSTGEIVERYDHYEGKVPVAVWLRLKRRILALDKQGYFFPLDTMDAYQQVFEKLESKSRERLDLGRASRETYLTRTLDKAILKYHVCNVYPVRTAYRCAAEQLAANNVPYGDEAAELENGLNIAQLAELLPGVVDWRTRRRLAADAIDEVLQAVDDPRIAQAFMAYVIADGNLEETARLMHYSRAHFYCVWQEWLARARNAAKMIRCNPAVLGL